MKPAARRCRPFRHPDGGIGFETEAREGATPHLDVSEPDEDGLHVVGAERGSLMLPLYHDPHFTFRSHPAKTW